MYVDIYQGKKNYHKWVFLSLLFLPYSPGHCVPAAALRLGHVTLLWRVLRCPKRGRCLPHRSGPLPHHDQLQQPVALLLCGWRGGRRGGGGRRRRRGRRKHQSREWCRETYWRRMSTRVDVCSHMKPTPLTVLHLHLMWMHSAISDLCCGIKQLKWIALMLQWCKPPEIAAVLLYVVLLFVFPFFGF